MTRIAVFNQKGGVGKTTTALNLGAALAQLDRQVLLVDLDPQAHLSTIQGSITAAIGKSIFAFYRDGTPLAQLEVPWPEVGRLIPAHGELIKVDSIFGKGPNVLNRLNRGRDEIEQGRVVVVDCCPFVGVLSLNAVFAAKLLLVPVSSDFLSMRGAVQIDRTFRALEPVLKRRVERRYLLTRFDRRRKMSYEIFAKMQEQFGNDVRTTVISENVSIAEAPAAGSDIFRYAPNSRGAQDYRALATELATNGLA